MLSDIASSAMDEALSESAAENYKSQQETLISVQDQALSGTESSSWISDGLSGAVSALNAVLSFPAALSAATSVGAVLTSGIQTLQLIGWSLVNSTQTVALGVQKLQSYQMHQTISELNTIFNLVENDVAALCVIMNEFSGPGGYLIDPLKDAFRWAKENFNAAKSNINLAEEALHGGRTFNSHMQKANADFLAIVNGTDFVKDHPEALERLKQALDLIETLQNHADDIERHSADLRDQFDGYFNGLENLKNTRFQFAQESLLDPLSPILERTSAQVNGVDEACFADPNRMSDILREMLSSSSQGAMLTNLLPSTYRFPEVLEDPDSKVCDPDLDQCYVAALQAYNASVHDLKQLYGSDGSVYLNKSQQLADSLRKLSKEGLLSLSALPDDDNNCSETSELQVDLKAMNADIREHLSPFSDLPFINESALNKIKMAINAAGFLDKGINLFARGLLWNINTVEDILKLSPAGRLILQINECLGNLVDFTQGALSIQFMSDLSARESIRKIQELQSWIISKTEAFAKKFQDTIKAGLEFMDFIDHKIAELLSIISDFLNFCNPLEGLQQAADLHAMQRRFRVQQAQLYSGPNNPFGAYTLGQSIQGSSTLPPTPRPSCST